jgi:hypothetical protein
VSGVGGSKEMVGRLQELLERVQMRGPRARGEDLVQAASAQPLEARSSDAALNAFPASPAPPVSEQAEQPSASPTTPPSATYDERSEAMSEAPATPAMASAPPHAEEGYDVDTDSDAEVSSEVVEVDIDIDEPMPLESGAQPVAQQTMPPDELLEEVDEEPMATEASVRPPPHEPSHEPREEEVAHAAPPANEVEEPTPSSSRRPIAAEEASVEEAYAAESSPRHTPPPESGKQVAASPSAHPPSWRPSAPPPSLEGHTLIGGWREPGLGTPQISPSAAGMSTGARAPAPLPAAGMPAARPGGTEPPATVVQGAGDVAAQASGTRLTADVTRPELAASAAVASFTGVPAVAKPKTLGELLDLTLGL